MSITTITDSDSKIVAFADDTALLFSGSSWHEVFAKAQMGMNSVSGWLNKNLLTLNTEKTTYIPFSIKATFEPETFRYKRRKHQVCSALSFKTKFAHRFFCYQGSNLYNKINRALTIYPVPTSKCKSMVSNWLQKLDYSATENLIHSN